MLRLILSVLVLTMLPVRALQNTGTISGTVTDPQGASLPGAQVQVVESGTKATFRAVTNESGNYVAPGLAVGRYDLEVEASGFKKAIRTGIVLQVNQNARIDIAMELGQLADSVSVTAETPLVDTGSATLGQVVENRRIQELPVNGRSALAFTFVTVFANQNGQPRSFLSESYRDDVPDRTVVVAEFPLASDVTEVRRAIPYGFSHGSWPDPFDVLPGRNQGITPAVRWSHYTAAGGGGLAILDRGLAGRELTGRTPVIFLLNTTEKYYGYPSPWLSGRGQHVLEYAMVAHDGAWDEAGIPQMAWEYNCAPHAVSAPAGKPVSFLQSSGNVIVESMRRDGDFIEVRLVECLGKGGTAQLTLNLPHTSAAITNMVGGDAKPLRGGPRYQLPVRPQQIVTLRFRTASGIPVPKPLLEWDPLVPEHKRAALHRYSSQKGHPPRGV